MNTRLVLFLCALGSSSLGQGAGIEFRDITWPRHDKKTGFLEWELHARKAWPRPNNVYICLYPRLRTYEVVVEGDVKRAREELRLEANRGTYAHGLAKSVTQLEGNVKAQVRSDEPTTIFTEKATLTSSWDKTTKAKERRIETRSDVTIASTARTLTGRGMTVMEQSTDKQGERVLDVSTVKVYQNVRMTIEGEGESDLLPVIPGSASSPQGKSAQTVITSAGPLVFDRLANVARFRNDVTLLRQKTKLVSDRLTLTFHHVKTEAGMALKPRTMLAEQNVTVSNPDQTFVGDAFAWDRSTAVGKLTGAPATMAAPGVDGHASTITFDQKTDTIRYTGNAQVELELETE